MATPFVKESKRHQPLEIFDLDKILTLLKRHRFSSHRYYDLGLYLGLTHHTLHDIQNKYYGDFDRCLAECLKAWLRQEDNVDSVGGPTYDTLIQALRKMGANAVADRIERDLRGHIVPPTANPISTEDTPAADRIPDTQNPPTERKIEEWLKEGEVELEITRINMHGAPGAGKTCSQHLLLNEPPPSSTDSTPIACPAVKATRISIDGENKWERVKEEDLLNQLASDFKEAPNETKHETTSTKINEAQMSSDRSGEPSLEDPTKNKPAEKKPTDMEVIKEISDALEKGNAKNLSKNWVYFIDSGGQPAYRELLPLFTRAAALNIITIDLTKGLDKKCKFQYRISQHASPINTDLKYSNRDIIRSTISSEAMLNPIEIPYVSDMPKHSHYLILGTRKELVTEEKLKELNESLIEYKANKKVILHNKRQGSIIFPVNTLLPAGSKERKGASESLCKAISNCGVAMVVKLPVRLFTFEIALQREAKKKKQSFLTRHEVIQIGKSLQLDKESESDIDVALQYLHDVTIILYYHEVLPNIIFVDPKPILDVFSHLIAITYVDHDKLNLIANPPPLAGEISSLIDFGLFKEGLLKVIGEKIFNDDFQPSHMITLLKHLHIIAKVENRQEGDYFFPCALPSYDKLNPAPTEIQPLLIAWEIDNSGTTTLAIPQGLFPLTIVHLLEKKDSVEFTRDPADHEYYRYNDAMSLRVCIEKEDYTIDIINRFTHIEICLDESSKEFCPQIRELVADAIKESSDDLKVGENHILAFKCSTKKQCYCIVKEDKSSTRCTRCRSHCKVLQGDDDSYRCWFSDYQSSSPGTKASSEDPPTKSASDRFRRISDRLVGSISSCLTTVSGKLNARSLITQELHDEMINGRDIDSRKTAKLVLAIQTNLDAHSSPETYLNDVCSALKDVGEKQITDIVNELERDIVPPTANPISTEDTPAADRIPDTQNPLTETLIKNYTRMTDKFHSSLLNAVKEALAIKSIDDVKRCLLDLIKVADWAKEVNTVTDKTSFEELLQRYCFLSNLSLLKCIIEELSLNESKLRIDQLAKERDAFYSKVLAKDFAAAEIEDHNMLIKHHVEMIVVVSWPSSVTTLATFEKYITEEFKDLSMFIALRAVHHSWLTFECTVPIWALGALSLAAFGLGYALHGIQQFELNNEVIYEAPTESGEEINTQQRGSSTVSGITQNTATSTTDTTKTTTPSGTNNTSRAEASSSASEGSHDLLALPRVTDICDGNYFEYADKFNDEIAYRMNKPTRGYCLIIHMTRGRDPGNSQDVKRLRNCFETLKFVVADYPDLTKAQINEFMINVQESDYSHFCCFVMFILAHGDDDTGSPFFGTRDNKTYEVSEIKKKIQSIKGLNGKPKLLFAQLCRGEKFDTGIDPVEESYRDNNTIPNGSDFLLSFATIKDYASFRNKDGTLFIQHLCDVFTAYHTQYDVLSMMTIVTKRVADVDEVETASGKKVKVKQNPEIISTFRKFLYFGKPPPSAIVYDEGLCKEKKTKKNSDSSN